MLTSISASLLVGILIPSLNGIFPLPTSIVVGLISSFFSISTTFFFTFSPIIFCFFDFPLPFSSFPSSFLLSWSSSLSLLFSSFDFCDVLNSLPPSSSCDLRNGIFFLNNNNIKKIDTGFFWSYVILLKFSLDIILSTNVSKLINLFS